MEKSDWEACEDRCTCGDRNTVYRRVDDDEGHSDIELHCHSCGRTWWEEGSDY